LDLDSFTGTIGTFQLDIQSLFVWNLTQYYDYCAKNIS
jgi:hypothetical protein